MTLRFPPAWVPQITLDDDRIELALAFYQWTSAFNLFRWVTKDTLVIVGTYLKHHQTVLYWEIILQGGVRGYSLLLHTHVELQWYVEHNLNPFNATVQIQHYGLAHSPGLLVEHRFLQVVARVMGHNFSLRELILGNPHADPPQRDWYDVWTHCQQELSLADVVLDPRREPQVQAFYRCLQFQKVT